MDKPKTLQQAIRYFSNEQVCIDTIAKMRRPNGPVCPACGHKEHYYLASQRGVDMFPALDRANTEKVCMAPTYSVLDIFG